MKTEGFKVESLHGTLISYQGKHGIVSVKDKQGYLIKDYHRILPYQATVFFKLHYLFIFIGNANIEYT